MNRRWICSDVWMDILPSFDHAQLGLKIALISPRFDALVDTHFDAKTELTLWKAIEIRKDNEMPQFFAEGKSGGFPLPERPLPNKIRFKSLKILYIDHSAVISFLHSNKQIWDRGTKFGLSVWPCSKTVQRILDNFLHQIWPLFAPNIRHLGLPGGAHFDLIAPTMLTDLDQLHSFDIVRLTSAVFDADYDDDWPSAISVGQVLANWLHSPSKDGHPKRLFFGDSMAQLKSKWVNTFKKTFLRATTTSANYEIRSELNRTYAKPIKPFELVNERIKEKLTLTNEGFCGSICCLLLKRCPISGETAAPAAVQQQQKKNNWNSSDNLSNVFVDLNEDKIQLDYCFRAMKVFSSPAGPSSDQ